MAGHSDPGLDTLALHAGARPDPTTGARAVPLHLSTSFALGNSERAAALFQLERSGYTDALAGNPTTAALEQRMAALEGGIAAVATASGQAALHLAIATLMGAGGHIVASGAICAGSYSLLRHTLPRFGITTDFVDPGDLDAWRAAIRPGTRLLLGEMVGNPGLHVLDVPAVADIAHAAGLPLLVDNTLATPCLAHPLALGADLVWHSAGFLCGHGTATGGVLVDGGSLDWEKSGRFRGLTTPCDGLHGMVFAEESTVGAFTLRARSEGLRDFGACISPHAAWLMLQGLQTLPLRMARHLDNAEKIVHFLHEHPLAARVGHPLLPAHPSHATANRLLEHGARGAGGVFGLDLKGTPVQVRAFLDALQLFSQAAGVGDSRSLAIHPASTTHWRLDDAARAAAGVGPATLRLSVGLEDPDDLLADLKSALRAAEKAGS